MFQMKKTKCGLLTFGEDREMARNADVKGVQGQLGLRYRSVRLITKN